MDRPYLQDLWIKNYGCIQDAHLTFSPLHALIGPNDSGKTTILRAIQAVAHLTHPQRTMNDMQERAIAVSARRGEVAFELASSSFKLTHEHSKMMQVQPLDELALIKSHVEIRQARGSREYKWRTYLTENGAQFAAMDGQRNFQGSTLPGAPIVFLQNCTILRLDPDALRIPRQLLPDGAPIRFDDERGLGLPAVYDAIQNRDIQSFLDLNAEIKKLFPDVKSIRLKNPSAGTKSIAITLLDGTDIEAEHMSEGLLYYLAFAALRYIDQPAILLIEEPENGLHPARIAEVMRVLRELSKTTQIILATHSPLVINELEPHEVSVITRSRDKGTQATLIKDTANFEERAKVYALGELWLSYANGIDEAPLISGGPRP